jgi:hypothetical protein
VTTSGSLALILSNATVLQNTRGAVLQERIADHDFDFAENYTNPAKTSLRSTTCVAAEADTIVCR